MKKQKFHECEKCGKKCKNAGGLSSHMRSAHPYVPPPMPKKTTVVSTGAETERIYLGAAHILEIGDVFYRVEKHVVKKIITTEGSNDAVITSEITKQNWQQTK